jgi:phospholipase/carboxylesterase
MTTASLSLEHNLRPSSLTKKAPLILMLHGYGSDENDLFSFASYLPEKYTIVSAKAPYKLQPFGNAWYAINFDANQNKFSDIDQAISSRDKIKNFIEEVISAYNIDEEDVTLLGFSQGTILSFATALSYPKLVKNVVGLSGYIDKNMIDFQPKEDYKHLNIYNSHGTMDQVIPVSWAQKTPKVLSELDIECYYKEFPAAHGVSQENFASFLEWLNRH